MAHPSGPTNSSPNQPNELQEEGERSSASTVYTGKFSETLRDYTIVILKFYVETYIMILYSYQCILNYRDP